MKSINTLSESCFSLLDSPQEIKWSMHVQFGMHDHRWRLKGVEQGGLCHFSPGSAEPSSVSTLSTEKGIARE